MDTLEWLNSWYASNCNGDWEHSYGVKIDTLDNPGWWIKIDLVDTELEGQLLEVKEVVSATNWYNIVCNGYTFEAFGDTAKLSFLLNRFKQFAGYQPAAI